MIEWSVNKDLEGCRCCLISGILSAYDRLRRTINQSEKQLQLYDPQIPNSCTMTKHWS